MSGVDGLKGTTVVTSGWLESASLTSAAIVGGDNGVEGNEGADYLSQPGATVGDDSDAGCEGHSGMLDA